MVGGISAVVCDSPKAAACISDEIMQARHSYGKAETADTCYCMWTDTSGAEQLAEWCNYIIMQIWEDQQCLQNFYVRKQTFMELCEDLAPTLQCQGGHTNSDVGCYCHLEAGYSRLHRSMPNYFGKPTLSAVVMELYEAVTAVFLSMGSGYS